MIYHKQGNAVEKRTVLGVFFLTYGGARENSTVMIYMK